MYIFIYTRSLTTQIRLFYKHQNIYHYLSSVSSITYLTCLSLISAFDHWRTQVSSRKLIQVLITSASTLHELIDFESSSSCESRSSQNFRQQDAESNTIQEHWFNNSQPWKIEPQTFIFRCSTIWLFASSNWSLSSLTFHSRAWAAAKVVLTYTSEARFQLFINQVKGFTDPPTIPHRLLKWGVILTRK